MTLDHKAYDGRKPAKEVAGVAGLIQCAFCHQKFATLIAARMHENSRHKKKLRKLMETTDRE